MAINWRTLIYSGPSIPWKGLKLFEKTRQLITMQMGMDWEELRCTEYLLCARHWAQCFPCTSHLNLGQRSREELFHPFLSEKLSHRKFKKLSQHHTVTQSGLHLKLVRPGCSLSWFFIWGISRKKNTSLWCPELIWHSQPDRFLLMLEINHLTSRISTSDKITLRLA